MPIAATAVFAVAFLIKDGWLAGHNARSGTGARRGSEFNKQIAFGENHCRYLLLINKMRLANVMDVDGSMPAPRRSAAEEVWALAAGSVDTTSLTRSTKNNDEKQYRIGFRSHMHNTQI